MRPDNDQAIGKAISRRSFLASSSAAITALAITGAAEGQKMEILQGKSPLGVPWINPAEMAPVVVFLASDAARVVSGATFDVTGGDSANNI